MKKSLVVLCLILLFAFSVAVAEEIDFMDIQWGSNPNVLEEELMNAGFSYCHSSQARIPYLDSILHELEDFYSSFPVFTGQNSGWKCSAINSAEDFSEESLSIAGYNIATVEAYYYPRMDERSTVNMEKTDVRLYMFHLLFPVKSMEYQR